MKNIPLTRGYIAWVDDLDYARVMKHKWSVKPSKKVIYAVRNVRKASGVHTTQTMHRFILGARTGGAFQIDHIDCDGLNNTRANLRKCKPQGNSQNRRRRKDNSTGYIGVTWRSDIGRWRMRVTNSSGRRLGAFFDSAVAAAQARDIAALLYHGNFARLNFGAPQ